MHVPDPISPMWNEMISVWCSSWNDLASEQALTQDSHGTENPRAKENGKSRKPSGHSAAGEGEYEFGD